MLEPFFAWLAGFAFVVGIALVIRSIAQALRARRETTDALAELEERVARLERR